MSVSPPDESPTSAYLNRTLWVVGIATAILLAVALGVTSLVYATQLFFLIFTSVLFAIVLNGISSWLASVTPLSRGWALSVVLLILFAAFVGGGIFFGMQIREKIAQASKQFDEAAARADELLKERPLLRSVATKLPLVGPTLEERQAFVPPSVEEGSKSSPEKKNSDAAGEEGESDQDASGQADEAAEGASVKPDAAPSDNDGGADQPPSMTGTPSLGRVFSAVSRTFSTAFGIGMNLLIVLAMTIFLATDPKLYRFGLIRLFPKSRRPRFGDLLDRLESTLWRWALGRMATMAITGAATGAILWILGVPLPFLMGVVTGLLAFIPNIGGLIAVTLASLLALPQGFSTVAWVVGLYCAMQLVESYVLTPLIQKRQVSLPPALLIAFQAFMGMIFGFLGLMVASPLLAAGMVLVNQLYVKDALGDEDAPEMSS